MARASKVSATIYDAEGFAFIEFRGSPQNVGDACAVYVLNVANPLGAGDFAGIELIESRERPIEGEGD